MTETQRKIANLLQFLDRVSLEGREVPAFTEATAWLGDQYTAAAIEPEAPIQKEE